VSESIRCERVLEQLSIIEILRTLLYCVWSAVWAFSLPAPIALARYCTKVPDGSQWYLNDRSNTHHQYHSAAPLVCVSERASDVQGRAALVDAGNQQCHSEWSTHGFRVAIAPVLAELKREVADGLCA